MSFIYAHRGASVKAPENTLEAFSLAVAMGAASVMQSGSQPPEAELVWELAKQVSIEKL